MDLKFTYLANYTLICFYIVLSLLCISILLLLSYLVGYAELHAETRSSYECGFMPFQQESYQIDLKFYMVSVLFILFDVEVVLILPWAVVVGWGGLSSFYTMIAFICMLFIGYLYELFAGVLGWTNPEFTGDFLHDDDRD